MNGVRGKGANGLTKAIYHFLQSYKHFISEPALAEFLPDLFDWIHFRRVWRNKKQTYVFRNTESARLMPSSTIAAKKDHIIRILICQLGQEEIHTGLSVPSRVMRKFVCRLWLNEVSQQ